MYVHTQTQTHTNTHTHTHTHTLPSLRFLCDVLAVLVAVCVGVVEWSGFLPVLVAVCVGVLCR